jgi:hypothetical protein
VADDEERVTMTIILPADMHKWLRREAFEQRRPIVALIREAVTQMIATRDGAR